MRLLYVCSDFGISPDGTKGASIHLRSITRALARAGHEVLLLSPRPGPASPHPARPLALPDCPPVRDGVRPFRQWAESRGFDPALPRDLRPLFYSGWAAEEARRRLLDEPPDVIIERLSLFSCVGLDLADHLEVPLLLEVNSILTEEASRHRTLYLDTLAREIEDRALRRADAILSVSKQLRPSLVARGVDARRVHHIPNGVDLELIDGAPAGPQTRRHLGFEPDDLVVGFVGSLKPWHGVDSLVNAFARLRETHPQARLLIVGEGPEQASLRQQTADLGLDHATLFTGPVPQERVAALLKTMDVAAAPYPPSADFYFSPLKLFEYMAAGLCCLAPALGQIAELIDHDRNGLLFDPARPDGLLAALESACCPERRRRLGRAARRTIEARYTWKHAADRVGSIAEGVLLHSRSPLVSLVATAIDSPSP